MSVGDSTDVTAGAVSLGGAPGVPLPVLSSVDVRRGRSAAAGVLGPAWLAVQYAAKRAIDLGCAAALLLVVFPLMVAIVVAVRLTSPGSALYRSTRLGLGGERFDCLKFRTMYIDADRRQRELETRNEAGGPIFKIASDPRVTPVGRFLRATGLDELPQFVNVLKGDMSLVGPRPLPLRDCHLLAAADHRRHSVYPGITGLWQVAPERHSPEGASIVELDLSYIDRWSLWLDLKILARTAVVVVRGQADASGPTPSA